MLRHLALSLTIGLLLVQANAEFYSDQYDDIDVVGILNNDSLREQYYNCFMDTGPCLTPDAVFYKGNFPEAMVTKCEKCTEKQKENLNMIVEWYVTHQEQKWNDLVTKLIEDAKKLKIAGARK